MTAEPDAREARRAAFVAAGREEFFSRGYGGAVMSNIASAVGGSKTTLWTYFPSKQDLFAAVVDDICERYGTALSVEIDPDDAIESTLYQFATAMMKTILSDPILQLHRLVTSEAGRFPELGALFYERGPKRGKARLAAFIANAMAKGELRTGDPDMAARQFAALCQSGCFQQTLLGIMPSPDPEYAAKDIADSVKMFMRAWGNPSP